MGSFAVRAAAAAGAIAVVLLAAATSWNAGQASSVAAPEPVALPQVAAGPKENVPSALVNLDDPRFPPWLLAPGDLHAGGPPPDGIPAIGHPTFLRAEDVTWIGDREAVLALTIGGQTRGYPIQIMIWHEIVNDTVGGIPVAVTYCPLCNSGVAVDRRAAGRVLSFGTSGLLYADNLVMYDRQTESLWPQMTFTAAFGMLTGTRLTPHVMQTVGWRQFRDAHPRSWVLSRATGYQRDYGLNPYASWDDPQRPLLSPLPQRDEREGLKERVIGIGDGSTAVAVLRSAVAAAGILEINVGGQDLIVWHRPGQASALDDETVATGRDIGTVGVFEPVLDGRRLHFTAIPGGFRDAETGSTWNVLGQATAGPLAGKILTPYRHVDTFWFAWAAYQPHTTIIRGEGQR